MSIHDYGEPLKPVLQRQVRRDDALETTFYHITVDVNDGSFGLTFEVPDGSQPFDSEGAAISAARKIGFLLKPWLMDMIEKTVR